jgi:hypothetical protein
MNETSFTVATKFTSVDLRQHERSPEHARGWTYLVEEDPITTNVTEKTLVARKHTFDEGLDTAHNTDPRVLLELTWRNTPHPSSSFRGLCRRKNCEC